MVAWGSRKSLPSTSGLCRKILGCPLPLSEKSGRKATHSAGGETQKVKSIRIFTTVILLTLRREREEGAVPLAEQICRE